MSSSNNNDNCNYTCNICTIMHVSFKEYFDGDDVALLAYDSVLTISYGFNGLPADLNISDFNPLETLEHSRFTSTGEALNNATQNAKFCGVSVRPKYLIMITLN